MWVVIVLLCSGGFKVKDCTSQTAMSHTAIHQIYGPRSYHHNSCRGVLGTLMKVKTPKGFYLKFWCQPEDLL